jgi:Protein of unknown function (DUF2795)
VLGVCSAEPTRRHIAAAAVPGYAFLRPGIDGRSKMDKAQLERAVAREGGRAPGKGKANPFQVQKFLEAVGYPASKRELVREAKEQGAHTRVRSTLEQLPDRKFDSPAAVSEAIGQLS